MYDKNFNKNEIQSYMFYVMYVWQASLIFIGHYTIQRHEITKNFLASGDSKTHVCLCVHHLISAQ